MEVNSTQLALKLAARKALIIRSSGYLASLNLRLACYITLTSSISRHLSTAFNPSSNPNL
ncbi:hypothetical protein DS891_03410 [Pseudoalteromonas sp. JC28]|nr:hypothetical protein [Pseudoalteromonas sp. JC28]